MSGTAYRLSLLLLFTVFISGILASGSFEYDDDLGNISFEEISKKKMNDYNVDAELDSLQLIRKYEYPAEGHVIKTEDGYLLTLHRIPHGIVEPYNVPDSDKPVVLLQHGFISSSADWLVTGPNKSLAYMLADKGYDVWLGNIRGNTYSARHVSLSTKNDEFWDFSFDEMGYYDIPAMIDFILNKTGQKQLSYIGHSMGTSIFYAMAAGRPEYNDKIRVMISLAPVAYLSHMDSPLKIISKFTMGIDLIDHFIGAGEFLPHSDLITAVSKYSCGIFSFQKTACENLIFLIAGFDKEQFNMTLLPLIMGHSPAGASTRTFLHYVQLYDTGVFAPYNCNTTKSTKCYKQPPVNNYDLSQITAPVTLHYAQNDWLVNVKDLEKLRVQLRNLIGVYKIPLPSFNHIDFLLAKDAPTLVYDTVLKVLKKAQTSKLFTDRNRRKKSLRSQRPIFWK